MSHTFIRGLVGVSIQSRSKAPARSSKAAVSLASRKAKWMPYCASTFVKRRWVPPYTLSDTTTRWPDFTIDNTAWVAAMPEA
jgi:hypothetical protein